MGHPWPYRRHYVVAAETATVEKAAERLQRELAEHVARIGEVLTQPVKTWSEPCRYIVAAEGPRTEDGHVAAGWREDPERVRVCGEAHTHDSTA